MTRKANQVGQLNIALLNDLIAEKQGDERGSARLRKQQSFVAFEKGMRRWLDRQSER